MNRRKLFFFALLLSLNCAAVFAQQPAHSMSTSGQFIVYGGDVRLRGAMCDLAERTKSNLLHLLALADDWRTPLLINLRPAAANEPDLPPSQFDLSQIGSGLKMQLNLLVSGDMNGREAQRDLLRAILVEMIYRNRPNVAAGTAYVTPPDWLVDGILQLAPGHNSAPATEILQTMASQSKLPPLDEVVRQKRALLDSESRKIHDAFAMALVQLLVDSPNGRANLARYLTDLPEAPNDPMADLQVHFPTLARAPGKWWALSVARLAAADRYQILSAKETAAQLDRLLRLNLSGTGGSSGDTNFENYENLLQRPGNRSALRHLSQQLLLLATRAHPSYRPIVQEYYNLAVVLSRGQSDQIGRRFARVVSSRALVDEQTREMNDYMNWFEATQLKTMSGTFSNLLKNASADEPPPRRRDPLSVYLDSVEEQTE